MLEILNKFDNFIILFINKHISNIFIINLIFKFITILGDGGVIWIITSIVLFLNKKTRKVGLVLLLALLTGHVITSNLKLIFTRNRPFITNSFLNLQIKKPGGYSFPSGHTVSSFISATILFNYNKKYGVYFIILAFLIGLSRVILMVHYPFDVFAGVILGFTIGIIFVKFYKITNK